MAEANPPRSAPDAGKEPAADSPSIEASPSADREYKPVPIGAEMS